MSVKLSGRTAVVTGASKGIGAEVARHLAAEGARVVVNYSSSQAGAERVVNEIRQAGGEAIAVQADISKPDDIRQLFQQAKAAYGQVDVLVNNAGLYEFAPLEDITPDHFYKTFNLNVLGLLLSIQEASKYFPVSGGSIINVSSVVVTAAPPQASVYTASKAAVDAITRTLAKELGPRGIRVNSINPGMVETEGVHAAGIHEGEFRQQFEAQSPLGRIGQPQDIAPLVTFLASSDSSWMTGETFFVSGGVR